MSVNESTLKSVANFLLANVKTIEGIMADRRVNIFNGKAASQLLLSEAFKKSFKKVPEIKTSKDASNLLSQLLDEGYFVRSSRIQNSRNFEPDVSRDWADEGFYAWIYAGSQWKTILGGVGLLAIALLFVMFPLWPSSIRLGVWYLGMLGAAFIGFILFLGVLRIILYIITVVAVPPGIWLFPNLYEDVGFFESFVPVYEWCQPAGGKGKSKAE